MTTMRNLIKIFTATILIACTCSACAAVPADSTVVRSARETTTIEQVDTSTKPTAHDAIEATPTPVAASAVNTHESSTDASVTEEPATTTNIIDDIINQRNEEIAGSSAYTSVPDASADAVIDVSNYGFNNTTAYNFVKTMTTGSTFTTENKTVSFPYEGRWGVTTSAVGTTVNLKAYSNLGYNPTITNVSLVGAATNSLNGNINYANDYSLTLNPGAYKVKTTFVVNGYEITNEVGIYVDNDEVWLCEYTFTSTTTFSSRRASFDTLMSNAGYTPDNSLSITNINCDTSEWSAFANEVITDDSWSDGYEVMIIHDWICDNIAFDNYSANVIHEHRDYGANSTWNTHVGVCTDISRIFMIMCRVNGIPCVTCTSGTHMWNAVYINGRWYEMDVSNDMYKTVETEDMTVVTTRDTPSYSANGGSETIAEVRNW